MWEIECIESLSWSANQQRDVRNLFTQLETTLPQLKIWQCSWSVISTIECMYHWIKNTHTLSCTHVLILCRALSPSYFTLDSSNLLAIFLGRTMTISLQKNINQTSITELLKKNTSEQMFYHASALSFWNNHGLKINQGSVFHHLHDSQSTD